MLSGLEKGTFDSSSLNWSGVILQTFLENFSCSCNFARLANPISIAPVFSSYSTSTPSPLPINLIGTNVLPFLVVAGTSSWYVVPFTVAVCLPRVSSILVLSLLISTVWVVGYQLTVAPSSSDTTLRGTSALPFSIIGGTPLKSGIIPLIKKFFF